MSNFKALVFVIGFTAACAGIVGAHYILEVCSFLPSYHEVIKLLLSILSWIYMCQNVIVSLIVRACFSVCTAAFGKPDAQIALHEQEVQDNLLAEAIGFFSIERVRFLYE